MKKILILNPCLYTLGGGEKDMAYFCWALEQNYRYVTIDILVYDYNGVDAFSEEYPTIGHLNDRFEVSLKRTSILKIRIPGFLGKHRINDYIDFRVYHISRSYDLFVNWNYLSKQVGGASANFYLCMFPPKRRISFGNNGLKRAFRKRQEMAFTRGYDKYLVISDYTRHWFSEYWPEVPENRIHLLYPPVFFGKDLNEIDRDHKKQNIILSVGRFFVAGHNKKQLEMVRAFLDNEDMLPGYEYHLVGALSNDVRDVEYYEKIKKLCGNSRRVHLHINCETSELKSLYADARFFWHATGLNESEDDQPDRFEHFGITTVEAMSYGVVPVVIKKGGQTEIIDDGINGFLWEDLGQCVEYTRQLIRDEIKRKKMAEKAVEKAGNFTIEVFEENCKYITKDYLR